MPRAFLVKHKKSRSNEIADRTDATVSSGISDELHINRKRYTDAGHDTDPRPDAQGSAIELNTKGDRTVYEETTRKTLQDRIRTLPCLTIPKPFPDQTSNVLRSMLYKEPCSSKRQSVDEFHNSLSTPLVKASAHSAFDRVVPGAPRWRDPSLHPTVQKNAYRMSHLSELQHSESHRISEMTMRNKRKSASLSTPLEEDPTTSEVGNLCSQDKDEPLDLQVKRPEEREVTSRPDSVESNTNSRESMSPLQNTSIHIPNKKKYFIDGHHHSIGMGVDISPPAGSVAGHMPEVALRTPQYLPSMPRLGDFRNPMNWTYAAYYQQYCGPYGPVFSRVSRHVSAVPGDLRIHQQSYPPSTASNFAVKRDSPSADANTSESYHSDNDSSHSPLNASPSLPPRPETPVKADKALPDKPEHRRPGYLAEHLNTIRASRQSAVNHRAVARQPILGLEYIQNGDDIIRVGKEEIDDADRQGMPDDGHDGEDHSDADALEDLDDECMDMDADLTAHDDIQNLQIDINVNMDEDDVGSSGDHGNKNKLTNMTPSIKPPQPKKYKCDVCFKGFSRSNTLVTHKRIHTGDKPFKCELCGRAFRQPGNLTRHRLTHTTVKPYVCPQCDKAFNRASNLHTHMRTHTNYKPFTCPYCAKGFHQKIDMKIHSYTHTGEKPHKCKTCGRGFKQLTHLTYHMRTHSAVKMYTCTYCGKGFNQKGNLQAHIYGHTGERPYRCEICDKGFTLASTLNTHRRTHAEKKPFQCQYCQKEFYQKNALKSHLIASHPYTGESLL